MTSTADKQIAIFGGGCFWCTEAVFAELKGVVSVIPGYAGGKIENPTYEQVCSGKTGHAEVIRIEYDPAKIPYRDLLTVFFASHDPTTLNRQGSDVGTQYRSVVFYATDDQRREAEKIVAEINAAAREGEPVVTEIVPVPTFYEAEDYHKQYYANNSTQAYCQLVINPKLDKVKAQFSQLLKTATGTV